MKILLEYVFIENMVLDYILLKETMWISKHKTKNKKLLIASFVGTMYVVLMLIFKLDILNYAISKMLLAFTITYIAFRPKKTGEYFKLVLMFFVVSMVNTGTMVVIKQIFNIGKTSILLNILIYIFNLLFAKFILLKLWKIYKDEITKRNLIYNVKLTVNGKNYSYKGFLDTGNTVYSNGMPIIFASMEDKNMNLKDIYSFDVQTVTLGNVTHKTAYVFEDILIYNEQSRWRVKAGVVFEKNKITNSSYNMILNYTLFTDNLGGIKI